MGLTTLNQALICTLIPNCKSDQSRRLQEIPQLIIVYEILLQPTSRRFLRELDEAPRGNNCKGDRSEAPGDSSVNYNLWNIVTTYLQEIPQRIR